MGSYNVVIQWSPPVESYCRRRGSGRQTVSPQGSTHFKIPRNAPPSTVHTGRLQTFRNGKSPGNRTKNSDIIALSVRRLTAQYLAHKVGT